MAGFSNIVLLSSTNNSAGASATVVSNVFDPPNRLMVDVRIVGYSAASTARIQFNGDTGTTAYAYTVTENVAAVTTGVAGAAAGWAVATTNQVARSLITFFIRNVSGQVHGGWWQGSSGSEAAATAPVFVNGGGIWTTTAQITRIVLDVGPGGGTLNAGTSLDVYGIYP